MGQVEKGVMEGVVLGAVAGVAFGLFQAVNRRANTRADPFLATFVVIVVSLVAVSSVAFAIERPSALLEAPASATLSFALAGIANFFLGWTFLALGQQRAGAARTSVVAGTAPLFGTAIAYVALRESVSAPAFVGVLLVVGGVALLASARADRSGAAASLATGVIFAVLTAISWGSTAVLARHGLERVSQPLTGVMVGMASSAVPYAIGLVIRRWRRSGGVGRLHARTVVELVVAGTLVAFAISTQWLALEMAPVAVVLALNQLAVPVVLLAAPIIVGTAAERLTGRSVAGAVITLVGTLLISVSRG